MAGAIGFEPIKHGFEDRCVSRSAKPLNLKWCLLSESNKQRMITSQLLYHLTKEANSLVLLRGLEPRYLAYKASALTFELREYIWWSQRDSNSWMSPWEGDELSHFSIGPLIIFLLKSHLSEYYIHY